MNVLFVPSIGLDLGLLDRLAASIDFPVQYKVAFNNGPTGSLEPFREKWAHTGWVVKEPAVGNRGVAGSWNDCATKLFPDESTWLIMNEDAWFLPGYLQKICEFSDRHRHAPMIHLNNSNAYYCFVWTKAGRERCGTFDENLWPAYYEDCDMRVRHRKMGITTYPYALEGLEPLPHGKPRSGGQIYSGLIQGCGIINRQYWLKKWGDLNYEQGKYENPYKDFRIPPNEWIWYPEHRAKLYPIWDAFINQPHPSIYE